MEEETWKSSIIFNMLDVFSANKFTYLKYQNETKRLDVI